MAETTTITRTQAKELAIEAVEKDREVRLEKQIKKDNRELELRHEEDQKKLKKLDGDLQKAMVAPAHEQLLIEGVVGIGTGLLSYKLSTILVTKTAAMVKDGESTFVRKLVVHGTLPIIGTVLLGAGLIASKKSGATASALYGAGFGLIGGSLIRSIFGEKL